MADGTAFCGDGELGYERSRTRFIEGAPLKLDPSYRLAHLPLVDPDHPLVIVEDDKRGYLRGRHQTVWSVVLPVPPAELESSSPQRRLERELRDSSFAAKIAWDLLPRRRDVIHATVCGGFGQGPPPVIDESARRRLREIGPIQIELRGLFSGERNIGRLYLRVYPESRAGRNALQLVQEAPQAARGPWR